MSDLDELYEDILLEHAKSVRRRFKPTGACACVEAHNPLCGDEVSFYVHKEDGKILSASYVGSGCAISKAASSIVAQAADGKSVEAVRQELSLALEWVKGSSEQEPSMEEWQALGGVRKFPMRVKCATMPMRAALRALDAPEGAEVELGEEP